MDSNDDANESGRTDERMKSNEKGTTPQFNRRRVLKTAGAGAGLLAFGSGTASAATYAATVDDTDRQDVGGWGTFAGSTNGSGFDITTDSTARQLVYDDLGITTARIKLRPQYFDDSSWSLATGIIDDNFLLQLDQLNNYNVDEYVMSCWSPPPAFKTCDTIDGTCSDGSDNHLHEDYEGNFVTFYVDVLEYAQDQGYSLPRNVSVQNELDSAVDWDGCVYSESQYKKVLGHLRDELDNRGVSGIDIIGPEAADYKDTLGYLGGDGFPDLDNEPNFRDDLAGITLHGYNGSKSEGDYVTKVRNGMDNARSYGLETWITEWSLPDGTSDLDWSINALQRFCREMVYVGIENWVWWAGYYDERDNEALVYGSNYTKTPMYHAFRRIFNNVPVGSTVRKFNSDDPDLSDYGRDDTDMVAFRTGSGTVAVFVNHTDTDRDMELYSMTGSNASVYRCDGSAGGSEVNSFSLSTGSTVYLPANSITVVDAT